MTPTEKRKLIKQASKLYTLGITVERRREKVRRLVEKKFHMIHRKWKKLCLNSILQIWNGNVWNRST